MLNRVPANRRVVVMTHLNQPKRYATAGSSTKGSKCSTRQQNQCRSRSRSRSRSQNQAPSYGLTKIKSTTAAWQVEEGKSRCSNGGAADDLIVKYINQDIETFHLARNCQVLSGLGVGAWWAECWDVQWQVEGTKLNWQLCKSPSKVDNVTVGWAKQGAYWSHSKARNWRKQYYKGTDNKEKSWSQ